MEKDTKVQSLIKGRLGASVLSLVGFACIAFGLSPDDTQVATDMTNQIYAYIGGGSVLLASIMSFFSKFREK